MTSTIETRSPVRRPREARRQRDGEARGQRSGESTDQNAGKTQGTQGTQSAGRPDPATPQATAPATTPTESTGPAGPRNHRFAKWSVATPKVAARVAILLGLLALVDVLFPSVRAGLAPVFAPLPHAARTAAAATVAVSGVVLLRVAAGLRRRKRAAWRVAVLACVAVVLVDLLRAGRRPIEAVIALILLIGLVTGRRAFTTRSDPRNRWSALRLALESIAAALVYGMVALWTGAHVAAHVSTGARALEVLRSLVGLGGGIAIHDHRFSAVFHTTLLLWGLITVIAALVVILRPAGELATIDDSDDARLRTLLTKNGERDSLGYFALRRDKSVVWSPSGKAAITYRVVSGVALISGDPLGDPEAWPGAIAAYRELVESYGWTIAAMGCSETGATILHRELGVAALVLGDEAVLDVKDFSLEGRAMRGVRQACTRVERAGYVATVRRVRDLDPAELAELRNSAATWRTDKVERGFSMALSRLGEPGDGDCVIVTARQDGRLCGLLHFVPWGKRGISLDLMRRDRGSDNGLNEFMITALMRACPELGCAQVSLNFAVFRDALERGGQLGAGPIIRAWRRILLIASKWWQIESLYRFNEKFRPRWQPRFFCYPAARDIPRVALAALEAEAFVVRPQFLVKLTGRG